MFALFYSFWMKGLRLTRFTSIWSRKRLRSLGWRILLTRISLGYCSGWSQWYSYLLIQLAPSLRVKFKRIRPRKYNLGPPKRSKIRVNRRIKLTRSKNSSLRDQRNNRKDRNHSHLRKHSKNLNKLSSCSSNPNKKYSKSINSKFQISLFPTLNPQNRHLPLLITNNPNKTLNTNPCSDPNKSTWPQSPRSKIQLK